MKKLVREKNDVVRAKRTKSSVVAAAIGLGLLVLSACGNSGAGEAGKDNVLQIGAQNNNSAFSAFMAQELGLLKPLGFDKVKLTTFKDVPAMFAAAQGGQVDLVIQAPSIVAPFNAQTTKAKLFALAPGMPIMVQVAAPADSDIPVATENGGWEATLRSLKGKKIGVPALGAFNQKALEFMAKQAGMDPASDFQFVAIGAGSLATSALNNGLVDVATLDQFGAALLSPNDWKIVLNYEDQTNGVRVADPKYPFINFLTTKDWISEDETRADGLAKALQEAQTAMTDPKNKQKVIDLLTGGHYGFDAPAAERLYRTMGAGSQEFTEKSFETAVKAWVAAGVMASPAPTWAEFAAKP